MPAVCGYRDLGIHDVRHLMFLDTGLLREVTDFPTHLGLPLSSYPNVVLGLHAYTHIYTPDGLLGQKVPDTSYPWAGYDQGWDFAVREAKAMDAALFMEEFGNDPRDDPLILHNQLIEAERHHAGFAFWTWKENGDTHSWGLFDPPNPATASSGCIREQRERLLARVYPRLTADPALTYHYDPADGRFALNARGRSGDSTTVVYVPREVTGQISSDGAVRIVVSGETDGSRLVFASPTGGPFVVAVSPAPITLTSCP